MMVRLYSEERYLSLTVEVAAWDGSRVAEPLHELSPRFRFLNGKTK